MIIRFQNWLFHILHEPQKRPKRSLDFFFGVLSFPDLTRIWGVDISHWDGNVNLAATAAAGAKFVIIKCTDGTVKVRFFLENLARAVVAKLMTGAYHWLYPSWAVSAKLQAQVVWSYVQPLKLTLPLIVDFEWTKYAGQSANPNYADLDTFVSEYIRLSGQKPILYSSAGYMNPLGRMPEALKAKFAGFWFANYNVSTPVLPYGFTSWDIWQFSDYGNASKLAPNDANALEVDLNYMTPAFYEQYAGTQGEEPVTQFFKATGNITIRTTPLISDTNKTGEYVLIGDIIESDRSESGFAHIVKLYRQDHEVTLAGGDHWCGNAFLTATVYTPPVPKLLPDMPVVITVGDDVTYEKQTITTTLKALK